MSVIWHLANPTVYLPSPGRGQGSFHCGVRGVHVGTLPCVTCWERPASCRGSMPTIEADLALSVLCVRGVLLHPVLDCVCFSLESLIRRSSGQKCLESSLGIGVWCSVPLGLITGSLTMHHSSLHHSRPLSPDFYLFC